MTKDEFWRRFDAGESLESLMTVTLVEKLRPVFDEVAAEARQEEAEILFGRVVGTPLGVVRIEVKDGVVRTVPVEPGKE